MASQFESETPPDFGSQNCGSCTLEGRSYPFRLSEWLARSCARRAAGTRSIQDHRALSPELLKRHGALRLIARMASRYGQTAASFTARHNVICCPPRPKELVRLLGDFPEGAGVSFHAVVKAVRPAFRDNAGLCIWLCLEDEGLLTRGRL